MGVPCFDIECYDWTEVVAVGFWTGSEYLEFLRAGEEVDPVWEFLSYIKDFYPGIRIFAHNAANFDNKFILNCLIRHGEKIRLEGGTSKLVWTDPQISFEDSYLLLGRSLASVCSAFDVPRKLYWDHSETKDLWKDVLSGSPTEMKVRLDARLDAFRAYLKRDVVSLSEALDRYCKLLLDKFGIVPSSTISLTSVKAFDKSFYPVKKIHSNEEYEIFIRQATFGGRNEIYRRYGEDLNLYDVRRMYLSCYDIPVPIGKMFWTTKNLDEGTVTNAFVKVPKDTFIGPLPKRWRGRLIFPVGEYAGWWDTKELRFACDYMGVDVTVLRQLRCDEEPVLKGFGEYISELSSGANSDLGKIWKLFGLRLCGKFGQHRFRTEIAHISDIEDFTGYYPIDSSEIYHERIVKLEGNRSPYIKPAINMRIRSEARIRHLAWMLRAKNVLYCDTDSVYTPTTMPIGDNPGDLHLLDTAQRAYFIKLKLYGYINKWGILKQISSGYSEFRLCEYDFQRLLEGKEIEGTYKTMGSWKEALEGQGVKMRSNELTPVSRMRFENRTKDGLDTLPIVLEEKKK